MNSTPDSPTSQPVEELAEALNRFIADNWETVKPVVTAKPNFWDIVYPESPAEIRYSRMLAWLLNPTAEHGLGTGFAKHVAGLAGHKGEVSSEATVAVEQNNIDILLLDKPNNLCLVIENKTGSPVHDATGTGVSQLVWYTWLVEGEYGKMTDALSRAEASTKPPTKKQLRSWREKIDQLKRSEEEGKEQHFRDAERHYLLLTPHGDESNGVDDTATPAEKEAAGKWKQISYERLQLEKTVLQAVDPNDTHVRILVEDFYYSQQRRFAGSLDQAIESLFLEDTADQAAAVNLMKRKPRWAGQITRLAVAASLASEDCLSDSVYGKWLEKALPGLAEDERRSVSEGAAFAASVRLRLSNPDRPDRKGLPQPEFAKLVAYLWQHRPQPTQRHEENHDVRDLVGKICLELAGEEMKPRTVRPVSPKYAARGMVSIYRTRGKGQGVRVFSDRGAIGDKVLNEEELRHLPAKDAPKVLPYFYVSGDTYGVFPNAVPQTSLLKGLSRTAADWMKDDQSLTELIDLIGQDFERWLKEQQ
ncbi:MAG: PD-(D/E)XK nuclease family protein [Bifidobacteriaceae bacterium]|nr:PD-(D/E)XK nuclease family protein [Bifidobacteriaceae bacterium]